jgi:hypothetical protein
MNVNYFYQIVGFILAVVILGGALSLISWLGNTAVNTIIL